MSHANLLDISKAALLVVDVQAAFRRVIDDFSGLSSRIAVAIRGFQILDRPIFITEQYPKGLGPTADEIRKVLPQDFTYLEKTTFSSCGAGPFVDELRSNGIAQLAVCGLETHICVNQTTHDLLDRGFAVHLLTDCVASRTEANRQIGLSKMLASGAVISNVEMALFELLRDALHEKFKEIQRLVK